MTGRKQKPPVSLDMSFGDALERFAQTEPEELAESLAADVLKARERVKKRVKKTRQEIEDGALPKRKRFRL